MIIDAITNEPVTCSGCGEAEDLSIAQFVFGNQVVCNACGMTVR